MARRKLKTIVERTVTLVFAYDPLTEGVPSEAHLRDQVERALDSYESELDGQTLAYSIAGVKTTTRRTPIEQS